MKLNEFLKITHKKDEYGFMKIRPRVYCNDGFNISIQADSMKYCHPRENLNNGKYTALELGFPNEEDELINDFAEDPIDPTDTVYGYVPIEIVDELIIKHGGIDFEKMFINVNEKLNKLSEVK